MRDVKHVDQTSLAQKDAVRFPSLTEITRNMKTGSAKMEHGSGETGSLSRSAISSRTHITSRFHGPVS